MLKKFNFIIFLVLISNMASSEVVYLHVDGLSAKNIKEFQASMDSQDGIKYLGYCTDLSVAQLDINRTIQPDDSKLFIQLRKLGFDKIQIKTPVSEEMFLLNCKNFEPRK